MVADLKPCLPENLRMGCPVWAHAPWIGNFFTSDARRIDFLSQYGSVFNTVEGNSSFYGLPSIATIQRWKDEVPDGFEFCFKFPRIVSHDLLLKHAERETVEFIGRLSPLGKNLGQFILQLPSHFEPRHLENLSIFLDSLPKEYHYSVEVRNPRFFEAGQEEIDFNHLLSEKGVDRVIFDTRALFKGNASDEDTENAQRRKPNLPVKFIATGSRPFIRFVGHPNEKITQAHLLDWVKPVMDWMEQGLTPHFFCHMPDDLLAPQLARRFQSLLIEAGAPFEAPYWPHELEAPKPEQMDLFS